MQEFNIQNFSKEEIQEAILDAVNIFSKIDGIDMKRMDKQIKVAADILEAYRQGYESCIVSAPTGFGKSIMAFFLSTVFKLLHRSLYSEHDAPNHLNDSYILTSNKFLQQQYHDDTKWLKQYDIVMLQGQSNYTCSENNKSFTERECNDESLAALMRGSTDYDCAGQCHYLKTRKRAMLASSTIANYHYWLTTMNYVVANNPNSSFTERHLTIFDECHVMGNIVQDMFSFNLNVNAFIRRTLNAFITINVRLGTDTPETRLTYKDFESFVNIVQEMNSNPDDNALVFSLVQQLVIFISNLKQEYTILCKNLTGRLKTGSNGKPIKTPEEIQMFKYLQVLIEYISGMGELIELYKTLGVNTLVYQTTLANSKKFAPLSPTYNGKRAADSVIQLQCTHEAELCKKAVHKWTKYSLFMSATVGDADEWSTQVGLTNYAVINVPQVFDYTKSPIIKVSPMISMSYKNRDMNMKRMMNRIVHLVDNHPNENGLIHTGNYTIAKELQRLNHPRILVYTSASEKNQLVSMLSEDSNFVLAGPSLLEGVDLKDHKCRFMIWAKVPYMSLGDKLTKKKMEIYKGWYNWVTMMNFLQGCGRGIRNYNDWCKTYIVDDAFNSFFNRAKMPNWISQRLETRPYDNLDKSINNDVEMDDILSQFD